MSDLIHRSDSGTPPSGWELPEIAPEVEEMLTRDILKRGILVPVFLDQDGNVIDGRVRMRIAERHGLHLPKIVIGRLTEPERADLRLILNSLRRHLSRDQVREYIAWELRKRPEASDRAIAGSVGVDHKTVGSVRRDLEAGGEVPHLPVRVGEDGKSYHKPMVCASSKRQAEEAMTLLRDLGDLAPPGPHSLRKLRHIKWERDRERLVAQAGTATSEDFLVHHCDFRDLGDRIAPGSLDLAVCDPPWARADLRASFAEAAARLLKPGGVLCCYTGIPHMADWQKALESAGLVYWWEVTAIRRGNGMVRLGGRIRSQHTPILLLRKGPLGPPTDKPLVDVIESVAAEKDAFWWQQPVPEAVHLIEGLSGPGALVGDLTAGTGTVGVATVRVGGGRRFVGCEVDGARARYANHRIAEELAAVGAAAVWAEGGHSGGHPDRDGMSTSGEAVLLPSPHEAGDLASDGDLLRALVRHLELLESDREQVPLSQEDSPWIDRAIGVLLRLRDGSDRGDGGA